MNSYFTFNNYSKYLQQYIIEILINLDYYNYIIFNQYNNNNNNNHQPLKQQKQQQYNNSSNNNNNNNQQQDNNSSNNNQYEKYNIKLNKYSNSYKFILQYGLVCNDWFIMVSNSIKYLSSNIQIKRYSNRCLINPYQVKYYIQERYYKFKRDEYGFTVDQEMLLQLYPNLSNVRYLITMDYSTSNIDDIINSSYGNDNIFKIKSISNLIGSVSSTLKSNITIFINSPSSYEPLEINSFSNNKVIQVDQLIFSSKFGNCSSDLINLIKYYFSPTNLITFSIKDYFSYSKDLIESLPSTLESISIGGNNSIELYSLSNLSRFQNLKSIKVQFHIHDILYHLGCTESNFINNNSSSSRIKFKESDYYGEINQLKNPCYKPLDDSDSDLVYPFGYSIKRLCSVVDDWYEMCLSISNNNQLLNLSIGNSCDIQLEGTDPLRRYMNNEKFYINSKGKEKYYSSEEESDRFDLEDNINSESDSGSDSNNNNNNNNDSEIEYINCKVIDDGSGGTIIFGGIPNKSNSDISSSSEEENDEDYIYDDSDVARCETKISNRFKKKKKRKEKQFQEYIQFLNDSKNKEMNQFKTNYYKVFNQFSLPKSFSQPLSWIITNNKSIQSLTLANFDVDINILSSFKNNTTLINLVLENVITNIQLEVFLDSILPTIKNLVYLKVNGIVKSSQNYTQHLNNLIIKYNNLKSINFDFNLIYK